MAFVDNPYTGFIGVIEDVGGEERQRLPGAVVADDVPRPLDHWSDAELRKAGLTAELIDKIRACRTEDDLCSLPSAAFEVAVEILDKSPEQWRNPPMDEEAEAEIRLRSTLQQYGVLAGFTRLLDADEAQRVLTAPIEDWMVFLHPDQRGAVMRRFEGPARVRGSAGTGKTVVGLHRAAELARRYQGEGPILFTTFVASLPPVFQHLYERIPGTHPGEVEFVHVDKLASTVCSGAGVRLRVDLQASEAAMASAWKQSSGVAALVKAGVTRMYAQEEIIAVIKGRGLRSTDEYLDIERTGRRMPLSRPLRVAMWDVYEGYQAQLAVRRVVDFSDRISKALEISASLPPRYRAAVIDEAQDISLIGLQFVRAMVNGSAGVDRPDGLVIVGDGAQRIYPGGYTLRQAGIEVRGRTTVLRVNYRNTKEVIGAAMAVAGKGEVDDLGDEYRRADAESEAVRIGLRPILIQASNEEAELAAIASRILEVVDDVTIGFGDIAVAAATNPLADKAVAALKQAGVPVQLLQNYDGLQSAAVKVGTHHRIKGLEFKQVFLPFISAHKFPVIPAGVKDLDERREHEERSLSQLFVAMTRARDQLFVTCTSDPADVIIGALDHFELGNS
jgi:UvrD-like helicase family protein